MDQHEAELVFDDEEASDQHSDDSEGGEALEDHEEDLGGAPEEQPAATVDSDTEVFYFCL